jgi:hypothetical protein
MMHRLRAVRIPNTPSLCRTLCQADLDRLAVEAGRLSREEFNAVMQDLCVDGVWRRTRRGRLPETERRLIRHLLDPPRESYALLDLASSDGTTTLDLLDALRAATEAPVTICLTDRFLALERYRLGSLVEYRTPQGVPVTVRLGRRQLPDILHRWDLAGHVLARSWVARRPAMRLDGTLSLLHPDVLAEPALVPRVLDCLRRDDSLVGTLDALRAANILNTGYFNRQQLTAAIACCHAYLRYGGVLVVVRCDGPPENETERGSLWRRTAEGFARLEDYGRGSEIADVVDAFRAG